MKFGEKRINPNHIIKYYPELVHSISFDLVNTTTESIHFKTLEDRDDMLRLIDNYLVAFDDGKILSTQSKVPQFIIDDSDLGGSGPGGISMQ
jgi:hypothetical protein